MKKTWRPWCTVVVVLCVLAAAAADVPETFPHTVAECVDNSLPDDEFIDLPVPRTVAEYRRTCLLRNVYMRNRSYFVKLAPGVELSDWRTDTELQMYGDFAYRETLPPDDDGKRFAGVRAVKHVEGLSVPVRGMWNGNIGHNLWDNLYPAFVSLLRWGFHDANFTAVYNSWEWCSAAGATVKCYNVDPLPDACVCMGDRVVQQFSGRPLLDMRTMHDPDVLYRFDWMIVGQGLSGQRYLGNRFALPYGRELNATRLYRDRMLRTHGVQPARHAPADGKVIVVDNKRYTTHEREALKKLVASLAERGHAAEYVDWSTVRPFAAQMAAVQQARVYVTGPGTGMLYHPFMADGSAVINLGEAVPAQCPDWPTSGLECTCRYVDYLEEYVVEGCPYQLGLYYPAAKRLFGIDAAVVRPLVDRALAVDPRHWRDTAPGQSLSAIGRLLREYCTLDMISCQKLLHGMSNSLDEHITLVDGSQHSHSRQCWASSWYGPVVAEVKHFSENGWFNTWENRTEGVQPPCLWNRQLLANLKLKYARELPANRC